MINERINDGITIISNSTGEVIYEGSNVHIQDIEHKKKVQTAIQKKNSKYLLSNDMCGSFYWMIYDGGTNKAIDLGITSASLTRFIYLCTFMDYDNTLKKDRSKYLTKNEIKEKINISNRSFDYFWKECIDSGLIIETGEGIRIATDMFQVGKLKKNNNNVAVKMFKAAIRNMYENTVPTSHKNLAYLFMLIPFLNLKYNVICENPLETDKSKIKPLSIGDICDKLGLSRRNQEKFAKKMLKTSIMCNDGHTRSAVSALIDVKDNQFRYRVFVNPQLYNAYINDDNIKYLADCMIEDTEQDFSMLDMID